jgi:pteridine reductase
MYLMIPYKKHKVSTTKPVALITGAASPLGAAICFKLAENGIHLALHFGKSKENTLKLQEKLNRFGIETIVLNADLRKSAQLKTVIRRITRKWGRLDLLINNASLFQSSPLAVESWGKWTELFHINTLSPCSLAIAAFPWLRKSKGSVVNITDIYGELPILKNYPAYSLSKAALIFMTKYLALEFSPDVRVNAVSPGVISFPKSYNNKKKIKLIQKSALRRKGTPEEIADAVLFLAKNRFVTGQILKVDGGRFIH